MRRTILSLVLCLSMLMTGCQSWNVNAFGMDVNQPAAYANTSNSQRTLGYHASDPKSQPLSKEEKTGAIVVIGLAIILIVGGAIAFS